MPVFFLDFDGVVIDSAGETAITAWRGGRSLWPAEWRDESPPAWLVEGFCRLRPVLHTGYEAFGLLRLAWLTGEKEQDKLVANRKNQERAGQLLGESGWRREQLVELFGRTRDHWLETDFQSWLKANRFYPGVVEALRSRLRQDGSNLFILTTKQERFVIALLAQAGIDLDRSRIFGLDTGLSKQRQLELLLATGEFSRQNMFFVEDRLPALLAVAEVPALQRIQLELAEWGYVTPADLEQLPRHPRVSRLSLAGFCKQLSGDRA